MGLFGPSKVKELEEKLIARIRNLEVEALTRRRAEKYEDEVLKAELEMREMLTGLLNQSAGPQQIARELRNFVNNRWPRFVPATAKDLPPENFAEFYGMGSGKHRD